MSRHRRTPDTVAAARAATLQIADALETLGGAEALLVLTRVAAATIVAHFPADRHAVVARFAAALLDNEIARVMAPIETADDAATDPATTAKGE